MTQQRPRSRHGERPQEGTPTSRPHSYLTPAQARRVYDRIGRLQNLQRIYEKQPIDDLVRHADFEHAHAVFELGYGTGTFAQRLLDQHLPAEAHYTGIDISPRMHQLATHRLRPHSKRVDLHLSSGSLSLPFPDAAYDRYIANYVLDLLGPDDIYHALHEAHRLLAANGLLCLTSLTHGATPPARLLTRAWQTAGSLHPALVGGCRPLELTDHLDQTSWSPLHRTTITTLAISSEVVVAAKNAG